MSLDARAVPRVYRILVTVDGEQVANTTTYALESEVDALQATLTLAYADAGMPGAHIEIFPA